MTRIFPEAKDYTTVNRSITPKQLAVIESKTGVALLPGQRDKFQYFRMTGAGGKEIGTIIAASQKGAFGAIEFVVGVDTTGIIRGLYVQRSRERDQTFKERTFLDQFIGTSMHDYKKFAGFHKGEKTAGTDAIIQGLVKEFVTLDVVR